MPTHQTNWPAIRDRPPADPDSLGDQQFSLRRLFCWMLGAALVLGILRWLEPLTPMLPVLLFGLLLVAAPIVTLAVPILTIACKRHAGLCPYGVYMHLGGMFSILVAAPAMYVPAVAGGLLIGGAVLMIAGPLLAIGECLICDMPADCHLLAWTSAASTALFVMILGFASMLPLFP